MPYFIYFLAAIGFWLLGWTVVLGMALLSRTAARRPLSLLDQDDVLEP
ncbi:hypothetical protein [Thermomonas sp.]